MSESNEEIKSKKGGKRAGAGRPATHRDTVVVSVRIPAYLAAWARDQKGGARETIERLLYYARGQDEKR